MHIYYDGNRPDMVTYNGATYRYVHSLQGDILGLQNGAGNLVVEYRYDAWGRLLSKTGSLANSLGTLNPFRYRGYVYDEETSLYYLRSRYYNPNWCRFISSDSVLGRVGSLLQHNLFAYCGNNPVVYLDSTGKLYISMELYTIALSAEKDEYFDFSDTIVGTKFSKRLRSSPYMRNRIHSYLNLIPEGETSYSATEPVEWLFSTAKENWSLDDLDLALSVGHASVFTLTVTKEEHWFWGDRYKVAYKLDDTYDFALFEGTGRDPLIIYINDTFGYYPMQSGILKPYSYTVSGEFYMYP